MPAQVLRRMRRSALQVLQVLQVVSQRMLQRRCHAHRFRTPVPPHSQQHQSRHRLALYPHNYIRLAIKCSARICFHMLHMRHIHAQATTSTTSTTHLRA